MLDLEVEVKRLREEMRNANFVYIDEDWADFLKEKETWIRQNDSVANRTLQNIANERVTLHLVLREIDEACDAGNQAARALNAALDKLSSAEGMSMWDTFLGGGLIVSALKYSEINSSDDLVHRAQRALRHFKTELMDVPNIATESFTVNKKDIFTFTDLFFDNIFSDWVVHSRITDVKGQLSSVLRDVRGAQDQLSRKRDEMGQKLEGLDKQEQEIIIS